MEDVKWLLRKCGLLILLLLIFVIVGVICWRKMHEEEQKVAEEVWEPPVEIENQLFQKQKKISIDHFIIGTVRSYIFPCSKLSEFF